MKFCKRYEDYMRGRREKELPALGLKQLKKILKRCGREFQSQHQKQDDGGGSKFAGNCAASGFRKLIMWLRGKSPKNDGALIQEGKDLVAYAIINSIAMRKILKKYDKVHCSKQGQAFRSKAPSMHIEILQSPWLCELMAFYINLRQSKLKNEAITELYNDCSLTCDDDGKPTLSCGLFDSMQIEIDLTCSICLNTVFDPVALTCGHLFCYMCCCAAASITIVDGLKAADPKTKCPLCRQEGVNAGAMHLVELNILLSQSCPEYWEKRCQTERVERVRQAKEHWQSLCREFMALALTLRLA
ncbi:probable E3 ubiquitin-protein ligase BAH1-like 1 isoform X2 [Musa acuminata AAA Group]|uniref:probable E3 ubiquitin-protein ligase BAH1-like 1 isoform X2 n=1 Tax=Musa acuminata AAA Group TaxID=214697 RepID=UPI0031E3EFF2